MIFSAEFSHFSNVLVTEKLNKLIISSTGGARGTNHISVSV